MRRRADGWRATLVGTTNGTTHNDATNGITPVITNSITPPVACGGDTVLYTYTVFNPFTSDLTFSFFEDLDTVVDYSGDTINQSESPINGTFLPATLSATHGGAASFANGDKEMTITSMTVPARSTITFTILMETPILVTKVYYSQANIFGLSSPDFPISARAAILSDDNRDGLRANPTSLDIDCARLLPVELISFNVSEDHGKAHLDWITATEVNNSHFEIQRSINGRDWITLGEVAGKGTTYEISTYHFVDESTIKGYFNYYRLRQFDFDGNIDHSRIEGVYIEASSKPAFFDVNLS